MSDWKLPWAGGCRCDRVRISITAAPILTMACHCTGCQRMSASAFSLSVAIPTAGFAVTQGEPVIGGLHGASKHYHCDHCKSWMFTKPDGLDDFVNVRATMIDDHRWYTPFVETSRSEGFPWATTGAVHSFPNIPDNSVFGPLVAEFIARGAPAR
ncbi:MAG: GFA family protein [Kofleriaceae bacterium]